jgi:hypothetical protein
VTDDYERQRKHDGANRDRGGDPGGHRVAAPEAVASRRGEDGDEDARPQRAPELVGDVELVIDRALDERRLRASEPTPVREAA